MDRTPLACSLKCISHRAIGGENPDGSLCRRPPGAQVFLSAARAEDAEIIAESRALLGPSDLLVECVPAPHELGIRRASGTRREVRSTAQMPTSEPASQKSRDGMVIARCDAVPVLTVAAGSFGKDSFGCPQRTDLSSRPHRQRSLALHAPTARPIHRARWRRSTRMQVQPETIRHSFKNGDLRIIVNDGPLELQRDLPVNIAWRVRRIGNALLTDRTALSGDARGLGPARPACGQHRVVQRPIAGRRPGSGVGVALPTATPASTRGRQSE